MPSRDIAGLFHAGFPHGRRSFRALHRDEASADYVSAIVIRLICAVAGGTDPRQAESCKGRHLKRNTFRPECHLRLDEFSRVRTEGPPKSHPRSNQIELTKGIRIALEGNTRTKFDEFAAVHPIPDHVRKILQGQLTGRPLRGQVGLDSGSSKHQGRDDGLELAVAASGPPRISRSKPPMPPRSVGRVVATIPKNSFIQTRNPMHGLAWSFTHDATKKPQDELTIARAHHMTSARTQGQYFRTRTSRNTCGRPKKCLA